MSEVQLYLCPIFRVFIGLVGPLVQWEPHGALLAQDLREDGGLPENIPHTSYPHHP